VLVLKNHRPDAAESAPLLLVVEDDLDIREAITDILQDAGYRVALATNGAEAWDYLQNNPPPALMLLDLLMPVMSGAQLLDRLRGADGQVGIPTILMTASPQWANQPALPILIKPMRADLLLQRIEETRRPNVARRRQA
jgi:CheY-like chemotaxis protein